MAKHFLTALLLGFGAYNLQGCGSSSGDTCSANVQTKKDDCDVAASKANKDKEESCATKAVSFACYTDLGAACCDTDDGTGETYGTQMANFVSRNTDCTDLVDICAAAKEEAAKEGDGAAASGTCDTAGVSTCITDKTGALMALMADPTALCKGLGEAVDCFAGACCDADIGGMKGKAFVTQSFSAYTAACSSIKLPCQ